MSTTIGTNPTATTVNAIIQAAIFDVAVNAADAALVAEVPWLGLPIIHTLLTFILKKFGNYIYVYLAQGATFAVIDIQVASEKTEYQQAEAALRTAHLSGDSNAVALALTRFKTALSGLIHYDGSASP